MKFRILLVLGILLLNIGLFNMLPESIPMHWNINGQIDRYSPKLNGILGLQGMVMGLLVLFEILPNFDPKKDQYKKFAPEWEIIKTTLIGFFCYINVIVLLSAIYPQFEYMRLFFVGLGVFFVLLGNYLSKVRQNYFVGVKLPWTLNDEDNWNKTHRVAGWCFVWMGLFTAANGAFNWQLYKITFSLLMVAIFLPIGYSFWLAKRK